MAEKTKKFKVYAKVSAVILVILVVLLFIIPNKERVEVRFGFWKLYELPLYWLIVLSANSGVVIFLILRGIRRLWSEVKVLRREDKARRQGLKEVKEVEKEQMDKESQ